MPVKNSPPTRTRRPSLLDRIIKPSTLAFAREARRTSDYSLFDFLHGYFYGRWTYFYIGFGTGRHPLARLLLRLSRLIPKKKRASTPKIKGKGMAETYHGKVIPLQAARQLILVGEEVRLENLETIIPYKRARDLILKNPDHIIALDCPCRSARENPCLPIDVCLIIGEPFTSLVSEHHPHRTRWIDTEEAVAILQAEDERGHVHHAFFKDAMLGRFYAICNCCKCCCGAMKAQRSGTPMLAASGYLAKVEQDLCLACGNCEEACQFSALSLEAYSITVDEQACMGCGVCVSHCPQGALALVRDASKGEPLEILDLMQRV